MYDLKPLEEEWKLYRKKKQRPWIIAGSSVLFMMLMIGVFVSNDVYLNRVMAFLNSASDEKSVDQNNTIVKNAPLVVLIEGAIDTLENSQKKAEIVVETKEEKPSDILVDVPILADGDEVIVPEIQEPRRKVHIDIVESTGQDAYRDVENRFLQSRDVDDALFLANGYYSIGNYSKAEHWAMQTNKLDSNKEDGLLIFIKSKIKLGHKNEAVSILVSYIERTNSSEAKKLLKQVQSGKF